MPRVYDDDLIAEHEALRIYRAASKQCGDIHWRDSHPLAFITSLIYDINMNPRIRLDAAKEALKYIMAPMTPERGLLIEGTTLEQRFPSLSILLNAPEQPDERPN